MNSLEQVIAQLRQGVNSAHAQIKGIGQAQTENRGQNLRIQQEIERQKRDLENLSQAMANLKGERSGDPQNVQYIEQIPGRRVPFDLMVQIPIGANITSQQQQSTTVSQDGPFVAVARYAAFQSAFQFSFTDPTTQETAAFQGRSFGRYRPIHSAWDVLDGQLGYQPVAGGAFPGTGAAIYASPSNGSNFRTMEFDGVIEFENQGSAFRRQNIQLPSTFYTNEINSPFPLAALDFFERGEVLKWAVTPLHVNNPPFGNVSGFGAGGSFPFADSQYDVHEGVMDPEQAEVSVDPVVRLPNGILTIGFHGYRIIQPPGLVSMT